VRGSHNGDRQAASHRVLRLADELRQDANVVERSLGIGKAHRALCVGQYVYAKEGRAATHLEQVDLEGTATGVIPAILRARRGVQVEVDALYVASGVCKRRARRGRTRPYLRAHSSALRKCFHWPV
jgi:hypothetical protein